jgi:agmatine deiminase
MTGEMGYSAFRMPAEWAPQERIWLSWPHAKADWPGKFAPVPWVFAEMVRVITTSGQRVGLLVKDAKIRAEAMEMLDRAGATLTLVDMLEVPTNRGWLRDCGPIWVHLEDGERIALNWKFNAWAKYSNWRLDNDVPDHIAAFTRDDSLEPIANDKPIVLEGGGIEVNGAGSIIVTEEWLLSDTQVRNKKFTREDYEAVFEHYLGAHNTIWLEAGIVGDDTHGHVDDITRFVNETTIVTAVEKDKTDPNYELLKENLKRLKKAKNVNGKPFNIVEIPMPRPVMFEGQRLPASYANFLICNKVVLVPVFNDEADAEVLSILQQCFPKRKVVGIYARDLVWGLGTIHCLTQQEPV